MRIRKRTLRLICRFGIVVPVLMLHAQAPPCHAAEDRYKGFFTSLDFALTQPGGLDQHFATHLDGSSNPTLTERLVIDNASDPSFQVGLGYRLGRGLGSLQVSYWTYENDDAQGQTLNGGVYPTIVGYTYGGGMYIYNASGVTYAASSRVQANTLDLDYVRQTPISSGFTVKWVAGLRAAHYEEDQSFLANDGVSDYVQAKGLESDGVGVRVGAGGVFTFSKHFGLEASMVFSFLQANSEGLGTSTFPSGNVQEIRGSDDHIRADIQDFDLRGVWRFGSLDYYLGYSASIWDGIPGDAVPAGGCCSGSLSPSGRSRQTVSFNSIHSGITLRFGKTKTK